MAHFCGTLVLALASCSDSGDCARGNPLMPMCVTQTAGLLDRNPRIVFQSTMDGNHEIYSSNADGSDRVRLTTAPGIDAQPRWSPDGSQIAFVSNRAGAGRDVWVMNADGTDPRRLTSLGDASHPDWSPDGQHIAFDVLRGIDVQAPDGNLDIYVVRSDGSDLRRVTSTNSQQCPRWSPDGSKLVVQWFESTAACWCVAPPPLCPCNGRLALMNPDGSGLTLLPKVGSDDAWPDWSPDGRRLVFSSFRAAVAGAPERSHIMVMNSDGSTPRVLTASMMDDWNPVWSRSADRIFFVRGHSAVSYHVYSMKADGTDVGRVTANSGVNVTVHAR